VKAFDDPRQRRLLYGSVWLSVAVVAATTFLLSASGWPRHVTFFQHDGEGGIDVITPVSDPTTWLLGLVALAIAMIVVAEASRRRGIVLGVWGPPMLIAAGAPIHAALIHQVWPVFLFAPLAAVALGWFRPSRIPNAHPIASATPTT
jgi:hypothetical protein